MDPKGGSMGDPERDIPGGPETPNPEGHGTHLELDRPIGEGDPSARPRNRQSQPSSATTQVCVRVRPILQYEQEEGEGSIWRCERDKVIRKGSPGITHFHGANVFGPETSNEKVFKRCVVSCLDSLCKGRSCAIMAYGEETSGKSHSLMGSEDDSGIIRLSLIYLFKAVQQMRGVTGIAVSYCEVYNEVLSDLLKIESVALPLVQDPAEGFLVQGATAVPIASPQEGLALLKKAEEHRRYLMLRSDLRRCSRSTTILRVTLKTTAGDASASFVDLAASGSWDSDAENTVLGRAEGGAGVVRSVVNLRGIVRELGGSAGPPAHRARLNSKLMKVLDHCVDGTSRVVYICTLSPAQSREEGSIRTLQFATDAARIRDQPALDPVLSSFTSDTEYTTAKPLFRVRSQIDCLWEELVPFCRLCQVTSSLPVPAQLLLEFLNSSAAKIRTLETEMADLRTQILPALQGDKSEAGKRVGVRRSSSFPSLADTEKLQAFVNEQASRPPPPPAERTASSFGSFRAERVDAAPSGRGLRRSRTEKMVNKPPEQQESPPAKPRRPVLSGEFGLRTAQRGRAREEALKSHDRERRASSAGRKEEPAGRQRWRRLWEQAEEASGRLEQCAQKLANARSVTGLTATSAGPARGSMGRMGGSFGQVKPAEQARRRHDDWRAHIEKLREELKMLNQRVAIVADMPVLSERMQELTKMEAELEAKKRRAIDKAIEAQEDAVTRLLHLRRASLSPRMSPADPFPPASLAAKTVGESTAVVEEPMVVHELEDEELAEGVEQVAMSRGPESGVDSSSFGVAEAPPPKAPSSGPKSGGSSVDLTKSLSQSSFRSAQSLLAQSSWREPSTHERRALRQSRDKPWMSGSTRSIKTQLRQAVSDSRAGQAGTEPDSSPASTRPSSAHPGDIGEASSEAASAASTEKKRHRVPARDRERPWRANSQGTLTGQASQAEEQWDKVGTAPVKDGDASLEEAMEEDEEEPDAHLEDTPRNESNASSAPHDSVGSASVGDEDLEVGKEAAADLQIEAAQKVEFPEEWNAEERREWSGWLRGILFGEEHGRVPPPPDEASTDKVQTTLEDLWANEIQAVESLCLKCLVAIEKVAEDVIARQRDGSFQSAELLWDMPKLTPLENHVITAFGDNRFGQLGGGTASGEGQAPSEVPRAIYNGTQPLSSASSWRNTMIVTDSNQLIQLGVRDMTQGALEGKPQRGTLVINSQVTHLPVPGHQIMAVACGWQHSLALSGAGAVFSWGYGGYGALGQGNMYSSMTPVLVEGLLGKLVQSIAAGSYSSSAITAGGALFTWGWGLGGQLGHGTRNNQLLPLLVEQDCHGEPLHPLRKVACGHQHIVALTRAGRLFSAGLGKNGRLGFSSILEETRFRRVERTSMNEEVLWIQDVCSGFAHTAALDANGRVLTCGEGTTGALGHGTPLQDCFFLRMVEGLPRATMLACGGYFTAVATEDKTLWTWGRNDYRQLGRKCFFRWEPQRKAVGRFQGVGEEKLADAIRLGVQDLQSPTAIPDPLAIEDAYPAQATDVAAADVPGKGTWFALDAGHSHVTIFTRQAKAYGLKPGEVKRPPATFTMGISMKVAGSPEAKKDKEHDTPAADPISPAGDSAASVTTPPSPSRPRSPHPVMSTPRTALPPIEPGDSPAPSPRLRSRSASRERPARSLSREGPRDRPSTAARAAHLLAPLEAARPSLAVDHAALSYRRQRGRDSDPLNTSGPLRAPSREPSPEVGSRSMLPSASPEPAPLVPHRPEFGRPGSGGPSRPGSGGSRPGSRGGGRPTSAKRSP